MSPLEKVKTPLPRSKEKKAVTQTDDYYHPEQEQNRPKMLPIVRPFENYYDPLFEEGLLNHENIQQKMPFDIEREEPHSLRSIVNPMPPLSQITDHPYTKEDYKHYNNGHDPHYLKQDPFEYKSDGYTWLPSNY